MGLVHRAGTWRLPPRVARDNLCEVRVGPEARQNRVKRQVLRGVFDDNIETVEGLPRGSLRRERRRRLARLRRWLLAGGGTLSIAIGAWIWTAPGVVAAPTQPLHDPARARAVRLASSRSSVVDEPSRVRQLAERLFLGRHQPLVPEVIPLAVRTVAVDPGHGGRDGGTSLGYGLLEKDLTLDIATRLATLLEESRTEVIMTRTGDQAVSLKERAEIANLSRADLFVSIHINWLPDRTARGIEIYYLGHTDDPFLTRLAAAENRDSGFSMADYRELLEGIYADVRQDESQKLAEGVQEALYETLVKENSEIVGRGVMTAPFVVLIATEMPAILAEVACISNDREARLLAIPRYRQKIAEALHTGIERYAESVNPTLEIEQKGTEP